MSDKFIPPTKYSNRNLNSFAEISEDLSTIGSLICRDNQLKNFAGLPHEMPYLESLFMGNNQLQSLDGFPRSAPLVRVLFFDSNQFTSLEDLRILTPLLEELNVDHNQLTSLKNLSKLPCLTHISAVYNKISTLEGFPSKILLKKLHVSGNSLENFIGFPTLPPHLIPQGHEHTSAHFDIDLEFYDNPLRSLHGIPRYYLQSAIKSFLLTNENRWTPYYEEITRQAHLERIQSFQFSPHGLKLIQKCFKLLGSYLKRYSDVDSFSLYESYEALYDYYKRSPADLAHSYIQDSASISEEEFDRLVHECNKSTRDYLEIHLPSTDPVLKAIDSRLTVQAKFGYSLFI